MSDTPDIATCVVTRPALDQTITITIPAGLLGMLDAIASNVKNADDTPKYAFGLNVIYQDVIAMLLPYWLEQVSTIQTASLLTQITTARTGIQDAADTALAQLTVVGP